MPSTRIGYVTVSNRVMVDGIPVGYLYREKGDSPADSGWRVFAGDEAQEYADTASNFALYNVSTLLEREPGLAEVLIVAYPAAFERRGGSDAFVATEPPLEGELD